jgi:hypothetical protein
MIIGKNTQIFKFPPQLDIYQKTLLLYILRYFNDPLFSYGHERWEEFCSFYCFDFNLIKKYIDSKSELDLVVMYDDGGHDFLNYRVEENEIIDDLFRYYLTTKYLHEIKLDSSRKSLYRNIDLYRVISNSITIMNADIATRECMDRGFFDHAFTPQNDAIGNIASITDILQLTSISSYKEDKDMLENLYCVYNNNICTYLDMLVLILSLQVIKFSPFLTPKEHLFFQNLFDIIFKLLKDAKVIAVFKNSQHFNTELNWMDRGATDQTTRIQILYEYFNQDQYCLRIDLAHKGIHSFHLNNLSKGGVEFFPLDKLKFFEVKSIHDEYKDWFFEYGNGLYFLKDNKKNIVYHDEHRDLLHILNENSHMIVPDSLDEPRIIDMLNIWINLLTNVGDWMPRSKIRPEKYYYQRFIYNYIEEYFYRKKLEKEFDEENFKAKIIAYLVRISFYNEKDVDALSSFSVSEIFYLVINDFK